MLKNQYTLVQSGICRPSGNFKIIQHLPQFTESQSLVDLPNNSNNNNNNKTQLSCGQFMQTKSCCFLFNCCSCRTVNNLTLTLYQQIVSKAFIESCINIFPCIIQQSMIVTNLNGLLLGIIRKQNCLNSNILTIYDSQQNVKYSIKRQKFQCSSLVPRFLRCGKNINYSIISQQSNKQIGEIVNRTQGNCLSQLFTYLDTYEVNLPHDSNDKDKILLLNAVVYLDIIKHLMF